jgi:hypothetical protein
MIESYTKIKYKDNMDFLIEQHIFQGRERERKRENIVRAKQSVRPPHASSHLVENIMIFLMLLQMGNFHHLNPLHAPLEACKVA